MKKRILCSDWLPQSKMGLSCPPEIAACSRKSEIILAINPLLTKLIRSRWLDIGLVLLFLFCFVFSFLVFRFYGKELGGQYPVILTSWSVNTAYTLTFYVINDKSVILTGPWCNPLNSSDVKTAI